MFLADVMAAQAKCDEARKTVHQRLADMFGAGAPAEMVTMFDPILDYTCGNLDGLKSVDNQLLVSGFARVQFDYLLTIGDFEKALKIAEANELLENWSEMLEVSLAFSLSGKFEEADWWRLKASEKMAAEGVEERVAAKWLKEEYDGPQKLDHGLRETIRFQRGGDLDVGDTQAEAVFGSVQSKGGDRSVEGIGDDQPVGVEAWRASDADSSVEEAIAGRC
jgi:hypothetical protein